MLGWCGPHWLINDGVLQFLCPTSMKIKWIKMQKLHINDISGYTLVFTTVTNSIILIFHRTDTFFFKCRLLKIQHPTCWYWIIYSTRAAVPRSCKKAQSIATYSISYTTSSAAVHIYYYIYMCSYIAGERGTLTKMHTYLSLSMIILKSMYGSMTVL